MKPPTLIKDF
jgi:hypothetical protein